MLSEDSVPIANRCLLLQGQVSTGALQQVRKGLPASWPETTICLFAAYAYADLPLGKEFGFAFPENHPDQGEKTRAVIRAVTQEFGKPFDSVPHGWKTICLVDFPTGVPPLIAGLPAVDRWGVNKQQVALCSMETVEAIRRQPTTSP